MLKKVERFELDN